MWKAGEGSIKDRESKPRVIGRYALHGELASGGMATVHVGRMFGPGGFQRTVAIKRLLPHLAREPEFVARFLDEARIAARIRHQNVVSTLDVVAADGELFLVMEYVQGESLSRLLRLAPGRKLPPDIACAIAESLLAGLHAAHVARDEQGNPLDIVHRDISPQNVIVGTDGVARVLDFGIAKAIGRTQVTSDGAIRGKFGYMAPEQLGGQVTRATDIYAASIVLWECLTGKKYFRGETDAALIAEILMPPLTSVRSFAPDVPQAVDEIVLRGLAPEPGDRFGDAREMALALASAFRSAAPMRVAIFVESLAADSLAERAELVAAVESTPSVDAVRAGRSSSHIKIRTQPIAAARPDGEPVLALAPKVDPAPPPPKRARALAVGLVLFIAAIALVGIGRQVGHAAGASEPRENEPAVTAALPMAPASGVMLTNEPAMMGPPSSTVAAPAPPDAVPADPVASARKPAGGPIVKAAAARVGASKAPPGAKAVSPKPLKMDLE